MIFEYVLGNNLPRLAWFLRLRAADAVVRVEHGPWVEVHNDFFCEGAWNGGSFHDGAFPESSAFIGSGARIDGDRVVVAAATNTIERLQVIRAENEVLASNSLAFLLERAGDGLDPTYKGYEWDFCSIIKGLDKYKRWIPTKEGNRVWLFYHCNLVISSKLSISVVTKNHPKSIESFDGYRALLLDAVHGICANAQDRARKIVYTPISTISSGYDSPTVAVLARENGCTEALTFRTPRPLFGDDDRGTEIGNQLGLTDQEFDTLAYMTRDDFPEAEFLACGYGGDDAIFAAFEQMLAGRLLFTGFHGDKVWERTNRKVSASIVRGDPSGGSMQEYRLRVGFLHLAVPFIHCTLHPDIHRISNSEEMTAWRINNREYDRPIPRRIVEEASVPRSWFGTSKRAAAVTFPPMVDEEDMYKIMSAHSIDDYETFSSTIPVYRGLGERIFTEVMYGLYQVNLRVVWRLRKWFGVQVGEDLFVPKMYSRRPNRHYFTLQWAIQKTAVRYSQPAGESDTSSPAEDSLPHGKRAAATWAPD
jgi:hypothetical protein